MLTNDDVVVTMIMMMVNGRLDLQFKLDS